MIAIMRADFSRTPKDQLQHAIQVAIHQNFALYIAQLLVGLGCSVLGGYVAAVIAKQFESLNGLLSCWLCVAGGILMLVMRLSHEPLAQQILLLLASPLLAFFGGYLRSRQVHRAVESGIAPIR